MTSNGEGKVEVAGRTRGRKSKTREQSHQRIGALFNQKGFDERKRTELLSLVSEYFAEGCTSSEIRGRIMAANGNDQTYVSLFHGENFWDLVREAAEKGMFIHTPPESYYWERQVVLNYGWLARHVRVVSTAASNALARGAAEQLLLAIQNIKKHQKRDDVHVGFAGGMTLRRVAEELAILLRQPHPDNPGTIVFHSMVAAFDDDDFFADPNSFLTYFVTANPGAAVRFVRLPLPGIVKKSEYDTLRNCAFIREIYERKQEIDIIVTSGSLWEDPHGTLKTYIEAAYEKEFSSSEDPSAQSTEKIKKLKDAVNRPFEEQRVIGDLLWQPVNEFGPVNLELDYDVATLMRLNELPDFIKKGGMVLLVMGCSGLSRLPKSKLLRALLGMNPRLITDVVADTPTVAGMYSQEPTAGLAQ